MGRGDIKRMLNPESIALIGATEKEGSVGRNVFENLYYWSKERRLFPVNPKRSTVFGVKCYSSVLQVPEHIDLSLIAIPAPRVPEAVQECGQAGVDGIVVISSGFREIGPEGKRLEEEIRKIRKQYGMRIIGPNCQGILRPWMDLNASLLRAVPKRGNIAFISQSGALGGAIFNWAILAHAGFSLYVSLGSMIDVDFGDLIDFLGSDPFTRSIILYVEEGIGQAKKWMSAVKGFARNKPILVVKPGRFTEAASPSRSHTGAMVNSDEVYEAAFKRVGVVRVKRVSDLFNVVRVLHARRLPKGNRLAIVTNASGVGVMAVDALLESGGKLATLSEESLRRLHSILPSHWSKGNPVDVLPDADIERYVQTVTACLNDSGADGVLIIYTQQERANSSELAKAIAEISKTAWKPVITAWMGGKEAQDGRDLLFQHDLPTYETPEEAVTAYLYLYHYQRSLELLYETPAELPVSKAPSRNDLKAFIRRALNEGRESLNEEESMGFLTNYGIPILRTQIAQDLNSALRIAEEITYPIVLKIVSPDIPCRSEVEGVVIGIPSAERLKDEYDYLISRVKTLAPDATIEGVAVQRMVEKIDYEMILGSKKDKEFGPVILFGRGGIEENRLKDFSIGLPPMNQTLARRLMEETEIYGMIQGSGCRSSVDLRQLEQIVVRFSDLIGDFPEIAEMDIAPLIISRGRAYALGARIVLDRESLNDSSPYPHLVVAPYPTRHVTRWNLSDETEILFRPIKPEDEPLLKEMLSTLSEETLKRRFFQVIKSVTHEMLIKLCNIDYDREMAIVAEIREDQKRTFVGLGGLMVEPDFKRGEFGVVVHDHYQGKGIGYKLIDSLIGIAREKGLEEFYGIVLPENKTMIGLCQRLGFVLKPLPDGLSLLELALK